MTPLPRVELQLELLRTRDQVWPFLSSAEGLARWMDEAELDPQLGGAVRLRLLDAVVTGVVVAWDPPQHISFTWDYPDQPLAHPTVVAFDAIDHGARTHVTVRQVGFRSAHQRELHEALWRVWFERFHKAVMARAPVAASS